MAVPELLFAYRLAAKLGIEDPESLMDRLSEEQFSRWLAVSVIDGWNDGWRKTAEVIATVINSTSRQIVARSSNPRQAHRETKWFAGHEIVDQLTGHLTGKKPKHNKNEMSPEKAKQHLSRMFG